MFGFIKEGKGFEEFYEEMLISKYVVGDNLVSVIVRKCFEISKNIVSIEIDLSGDVIVYWGVCKNGNKKWEILVELYLEEIFLFKNKVLCIRL